MAVPTIESPYVTNAGGKLIKVLFETIASQVKMKNAEGVESDVQTIIESMQTRMNTMLEAADALVFKGVIDLTDHPLPTTDYKVGYVYRVNEAGEYAGQQCEIGDLVICVNDWAEATADPAKDFNVSQTNIDGAVVGPTDSVDGTVAVFDGVSGKKLASTAVKLTDITDHMALKPSMIMDTLPEEAPAELMDGGFLLVGVVEEEEPDTGEDAGGDDNTDENV